MGLRGPAPKPTTIKRLEGNPGKRKLNDGEPSPRLGAPECPDHLDDVARKEWDRLTSILVAMKVLTEADYIAVDNIVRHTQRTMDAAAVKTFDELRARQVADHQHLFRRVSLRLAVKMSADHNLMRFPRPAIAKASISGKKDGQRAVLAHSSMMGTVRAHKVDSSVDHPGLAR